MSKQLPEMICIHCHKNTSEFIDEKCPCGKTESEDDYDLGMKCEECGEWVIGDNECHTHVCSESLIDYNDYDAMIDYLDHDSFHATMSFHEELMNKHH